MPCVSGHSSSPQSAIPASRGWQVAPNPRSEGARHRNASSHIVCLCVSLCVCGDVRRVTSSHSAVAGRLRARGLWCRAGGAGGTAPVKLAGRSRARRKRAARAVSQRLIDNFGTPVARNHYTNYYPKCRARTLVVVPWQRLSFVVARQSSLKLGGMAHGRRTDASNHYEEPSFEDLLAFLNSASLVWPRCSLRRSPVVRFNAGQARQIWRGSGSSGRNRRSPVVRFNAGQAPQMWRGSGSSGRNRRSPVVRFNAGQAPQIWRGSGSSGRKGHYPARTG